MSTGLRDHLFSAQATLMATDGKAGLSFKTFRDTLRQRTIMAFNCKFVFWVVCLLFIFGISSVQKEIPVIPQWKLQLPKVNIKYHC